MRTDHDLIHLLDDEPPTPSTVDVRGAIATGRRRRTMRRAGLAGASVAATALGVVGVVAFNSGLFTPPAPTPPADVIQVSGLPHSCTYGGLPAPLPWRVTGADSSGRFLVGRAEDSDAAVYWRYGQTQTKSLPGSGKSAFTDVNASGTAVGWRFAKAADAEPVPFVYQQGNATPLPGAAHGTPRAINDAGTVVGDAEGHAVKWATTSEDAVRLPLPPGTKRSAALAVDSDGTIVGTVDWKAFVWRPDGTQFELPAPTIDGTAASITTVSDVRNGWVVGSAHTTARPPTGNVSPAILKSVTVRWNVKTGETKTIDQSELRASAVTAEGWLAGADAKGSGALVDGEHTLPLGLLPDSMLAADSIFTVSDDGRTVAVTIVDLDATVRPLLWQCE